MRLTIGRKELHGALQLVGRAVSGHSSLPVLRNVLLEAGADSLRLAATDLELSLETHLPATAERKGAVTLPARPFGEIVAALPEAAVTLEQDADRPETVRIRCGRSEYSLQSLTAEDFPALPEVVGDPAEFPQATLREMLRQVLFAVSEDDTRPILTGVLWEQRDEELRLVATDTHRLAVRREAAAGTERTALIPSRAATELLRLLGETDAPATVALDASQGRFQVGATTLITRLLDGQFPKYERVIPQTHARSLTCRKDHLQAALRRVRIVAREGAATNRVILVPGDDPTTLLLTAEAGDLGRAQEAVEVTWDGEPISTAANCAYLLETLDALPGEEVRLELSEPLSPMRFRPAGDGPRWDGIVMPMAVQ